MMNVVMETKLSEVQRFVFVKWPVPEAPDLSSTDRYTVQDFLKHIYRRNPLSGSGSVLSDGLYKLRGWAFNFRPYLKKFVVKQRGGWQEYYAPNKTALRNCLYGRIQDIKELI